MQFELLMCFLLHMTNGNMTFVKEYTTAEIICPLKLTEKDNVSWYYEDTQPIVIMNVINPKFVLKYSINIDLDKGELSINIYNFTENDEGKYSCQGIVGGEHNEGIVTVLLCRMSELVSTFSKYLNVHLWRHAFRRKHVLCLNGNSGYSNRSDINESFKDFYKVNDSLQLKGMMETNKDKMRVHIETYTCLTVNEDQCIITDSRPEFHIQIEWIYNEEKDQQRLDNNELYNYSCTCNSSGVEKIFSCHESIEAYYLNKSILFKAFKMDNGSTYRCLPDVQNKTDNQSTINKLQKWDLFLTYGLKVVMIICGIPLCFASIQCVKKVIMEAKSNTNQVGGRIQESELSQEEGYSSIDRRRNIQIGKVSYTANRVSMPSPEERTCVTSEVTINSQPKRTKNVTEQDAKKLMEGKMNQEPTDLNYIEVEFSQETAGKIFFIHGSDNGTPYADIDLTINADPLPESDSSADEDPDEENNFMTLADIQKLRENV
ncbi:uncharacterized protein [Mytilus edulis]|uniref:uncharacterized protein n=1 Tax=Mytilus edulis TaxID=6550 RepID=UPI0039EE54FA